jgi:dynactin complex subunit
MDLSFYYKILLAKNNDKVIDLAIRRIVDLNIRPVSNKQQTELTTKFNHWSRFITELLDKLDKNQLIILKIVKHFL